MSAHVLLNLLNELGKRDKMRGLQETCLQSLHQKLRDTSAARAPASNVLTL